MTNKTTIDRRFFMKGAGAATFMASAASIPAISASAGGIGQSSSMSMSYDLDEEYNRIGFGNFKWDMINAQYAPHKVEVPMGVADMDFRTMPQITTALKKRLKHENWGYEAPPPDYKDNIIAWNKERYNHDVPRATIQNCLGVLDGVTSILRTFGKPGDKIIIQTPGYSAFFLIIDGERMETVENPMKLINGRYEMDLDDLKKHIDAGARQLILCNPHNPTGNCWTADELRKLGDICIENDVLVIADEIHCDFVNKHAKYTPYATIGEKYAMNSFTLKSTSKSFNLASHRTAYMFSDNTDYMKRVVEEGHQRFLLNYVGLLAANTAYRHGAKYMDDMQTYLDSNAKFLEKTLAERIPDIKYKVHEGTYLAWLDCKALLSKLDAQKMAEEQNAYNIENKVMVTDFFGVESIKHLDAGDYVQEWLVEHAGVNINAGEHYGKGGTGYMRMNLGTTRHKLAKALSNIESAIANI